jgi:hypothetical protein
MTMSTQPLPAATVFLSYAHEDWPRVEPILQAFEVWEWMVASDRDDLNMGEGWRDKIQPRVDGAYTLLVAWSKISVQSGPVLDEVEWALKKNNRLKFFPVLIEEGTEPPAHLWTDEGVDLSKWKRDPKDPLFERVRVAIENPWTLDNDMALIRDVKLMKTIRGFVKRPKVQVEPPV